ncbi:MAG: hypothetical protein A4E33_01742 [Methanoregula sp. PtaB.Bin085]|nr:MAG: hypothetical protein A4E33_01742 [Methanoregula sp. PtaB.Bin085]
MCFGFCTSANVPSPKLQFQLVGEPVEMSVKLTVSGAGPSVTSPVKLAASGSSGTVTLMTPGKVLVFVPPAYPTVRLTVYWPGSWYVWFRFWRSENDPSPKLQFQLSGDPSELPMNITDRGAVPEPGSNQMYGTGSGAGVPVNLM